MAQQGPGPTGAAAEGGWLGGGQEGGPCSSWLCPRANQCSELGFPAPPKLGTPCLGLMLPPAKGLHCRACLGRALGLSMPTWTVRLTDTCWAPCAQSPASSPPGISEPRTSLSQWFPHCSQRQLHWELLAVLAEKVRPGRGRPSLCTSQGRLRPRHSRQVVCGCRAITAGNGSA